MVQRQATRARLLGDSGKKKTAETVDKMVHEKLQSELAKIEKSEVAAVSSLALVTLASGAAFTTLKDFNPSGKGSKDQISIKSALVGIVTALEVADKNKGKKRRAGKASAVQSGAAELTRAEAQECIAQTALAAAGPGGWDAWALRKKPAAPAPAQ